MMLPALLFFSVSSITAAPGEILMDAQNPCPPEGCTPNHWRLPTIDKGGQAKVKVNQAETGGGSLVKPAMVTTPVSVTETTPNAYVAQTQEECGSLTPCFYNKPGDAAGGLGTGLREAIEFEALVDGDEILILNDYVIKDHTVLVDKDLTIRGQDNAMITYIGQDCTRPMLSFTHGGTLKDLKINDGNCSNPSRTLIEINSVENVVIEHNTLSSGNRAVDIINNTGNVTIALNQIENNTDYAIFQAEPGSGIVSVFANNIVNNRTGYPYQINCNNQGEANHNFWGEGMSPASSALNCIVANGKRLGAPILLSSGQAGVEAVRKTVTGNMTYAFNGKVGVSRSSGDDFDVIIINHGQGTEVNIPFFQSGSGAIEACSNYYDVFLASDASATNLVLALKYDLNNNCITTIESSNYCSQTDTTKYPLWWFDPANGVTDGWDRTGQNPQGPGAGGATGQETICDMVNDEIRVTIDLSGRPNITNDLNFTPFMAGLPLTEGIKLSQFTATFNLTKVDLRWITSSEYNIKGFHVLRSESEAGPYTRISSLINAIGDTYIGGIYNYADPNITYAKNYYYKIEVINNEGSSISTHGPVPILTSTATPTPTHTRTPTLVFTPIPTRTSLPYYYRSPTSYYRPSTSTPIGGPTQVRTYGPAPTGSISSNGSTVIDPETGYPIDEDPPFATEGYPAPGNEIIPFTTFTPSPEGEDAVNDPENKTTGTMTSTSVSQGENIQRQPQQVRWFYLLIGAASGLSLLGAASVLLIKTRIP